MSKEPIIKVENLEKSYFTEGINAESKVLRGINLDIEEGNFVIIYGASGSGKSTLLHHIVGLEEPTRGNVNVCGTNLSKLNPEERAIFRAKHFGMVYQSNYWAGALNVIENVAMPLYIAGVDEKEANKLATTALEQIGMKSNVFKRRPMQLSGGEQQRIGMARALVNNPEIIIADEPTGNLDTHNADFAMQLLQELNVKHKRTLIMVTHNLAYLPMATQKVAVSDGVIVSKDEEGVHAHIKRTLGAIV